jgi:hypothetical protein
MGLIFVSNYLIRYHEFVEEWKKRCTRAKEEYGQLGNREVWIEQQRRYEPSLETWQCKCPSYSGSAYHICKHLIRLYVGDDGLQSNKPRMPFYGEVWRQSTAPLLWVSGVHTPDQLLVRDLRANTSTPPILGHRPSGVEPDAPNREEDISFELPETDPDDEYSDEEEEDEDNASQAGPDSFLDSDDDDFADQEELCELKAKERDEYIIRLKCLLEAMEDTKHYPVTHPHCREIPDAKVENTAALMTWAERRRALMSERRMSPTWGKRRRGNMYI